MAAQLPIVVRPAGSHHGSRPAVQLTADADGFRVALALVADPYAAWSYDSASLLRAGAALRTLYGGERPEPPHHAMMRAAENWAAAVVRCRIAADADAAAATLPASASAPAAGGPAPRIRPIAPAPSGAPSAPAVAHAAGWDAGNRSAKAAGRQTWTADDYNAAVRTYNAVSPAPAAAAPSRPAWGAGSGDDL